MDSSPALSDFYTPSEELALIYFSNEFPNDDLTSLFRRLHNHSKRRSHPLLARLILDTTHALREEVSRLPAEHAQKFPAFESIFDLAGEAELRRGPLCGSVDGVLLCVFQLATYIGYHEQCPEARRARKSDTVLAGLGIGLLVSTALSLAETLEDVARLGVQLVRIAFRLGVKVMNRSRILEPASDGHSDSWAYVVQGVTVQDVQRELNKFHERSNAPVPTRIFLSAISDASVTVSGPPARLEDLFRTSAFFRDQKYVQLPVYGGLCHAPHIYTWEDAQDIAKTEQSLKRYKPGWPVMSTDDGRPFEASTALDLVQQVIFEILTKPIKWESVIANISKRIRQSDKSVLQLAVYRSSLPAQQMIASLQTECDNLSVDTSDLVPWIMTDHHGQDASPQGSMQSKIAIVGMACRMPSGATDTEKFWSLLENGLDVHRKIPADRFDVETHHDITGKRMNTSGTAYGCFIDEPGLFDAPFFNMSPREAEQTDPMQRLALVTAYEALERSGYVANRTPATNLKRIGTWYGQASDDYREVNAGQEVSTYYIPGGCRAFGPGRINYFFKFAGPSFNCDTACSSSLATIQAACTALWAGDVDTIVAGGLNVLTNCDGFAGLSNGHFLTKTPNACKTWDAGADGYCRADAVGSIVLKRLEDAEHDNDNILGVITAAATNHSANAVSITHPHAGHQSDLYRQVMARAGIDPLDVSYVEFHGTGTQAGDAEEMKSITDVFAPNKGRRRTKKQPLHIGAVKANVGHSEAAAGVTALIKVLLMLQKSAIPPHVGIKTEINPGFPKDMDKRNIHIPFKLTPWTVEPEQKRLAVVNNFSAAGGNTTVALEEAPLRIRTGSDPRTSHTITVSAKSKVSLKGNIQRLLSYLASNGDVSLGDLAYSYNARRYHHNHRIAIHASDIPGLKEQLKTKLETVDSMKPIHPTEEPAVAFVFTGQGAAEKSMNLQLYHHSPVFRAEIETLDKISRCHGFPSIIPVIDGRFPKDHAFPPVASQVAQTCLQIALTTYWASLGVKPEVVIGHSLGEYAAFCAAGVLSPSDAIFLVGSRAQMLENLCKVGSHKMMAVKASVSEVKTAAEGLTYDLACINGPRETVLCGTTEQMTALESSLKAQGHRCIFLDVPYAFHSAQMDPILEQFEDVAGGAQFHSPRLPVLSPLLGKVLFASGAIDANYMQRATRGTVDFLSAILDAQNTSIIDKDTVWIEIGAHPVCTAFLKASISPQPLAVGSFRRGEDNWNTMAQSLGQLHCAGVSIRWSEFHRPFEPALRLLDLPTYSWNDKRHWIQYNGDWALTKGNTYYDAEKGLKQIQSGMCSSVSNLKTATVQNIVEEDFQGNCGKVVMQSDLMQPEFLSAAHGHKMNGCGVVTSSIHADIAYTLGEYLYKQLVPKTKAIHIDITDLEVTKGLVAQSDTRKPQFIRVTARTDNILAGYADLVWENMLPDGSVTEPFATCRILYGQADDWLRSWSSLAHLIHGRIESLQRLAAEGVANRFSHKMAYTLFASNLVDYADKYRGMQSVVMDDFEAFADVTLKQVGGGTNYTVPPYFIDSVAHLAGFVMNVSDASDTANTFCVTPGWKSMRFAKPLVGGQTYQSYVKMIPTIEDPSVYLGDVYILQDKAIVGMVGEIQFRRYPRILLNRFFSPPDSASAKSHSKPTSALSVPSELVQPPPAPKAKPVESSVPKPVLVDVKPVVKASVEPGAAETVDPDSTSQKALGLIAREAGMHVSELTDDAQFADIGVDSLMSLVISEKFREELSIQVAGSLFLEYPSIGALRAWLEEYYS